ncbi:ABC transporter ATP-binding protein [Jannaschia sp. LMIT008]|uniref:ABC transporter ATP-binding protein n=1 Tax=Jannaschia maritima TaxID=3032585 RepID=UPI00281137CD|nr:ATP-binding cassette domain-containing protein [Jannaschia sp. LMIT008]
MTLPLAVRDLRVASAGGRALLDVPALDLPAGALVGVRGPSGAGKTTLLHALAGLLEADGTVRWGETELLALGAEGRAAFRARSLGLVFQDFLLFEELGALENASVAAMFAAPVARQAIRDRAADGLRGLGIDPDDARPVSSHSGGERQRIAVARALAGGAGLLLADEPTASLHRDAADRLVDDLIRLVRETGATLIAVSHDETLIARMDRVLTIADGRIEGGATHEAAA